MEHKKTFGSFILQRRKELGMTQKEFASRLFVTESAVSKWERGLSYPDITLLQNICSVLDVSEHELLSGSEDTKQRNSDRLAERYIQLCRNTRLAQYILYGGILLLCAIVNLATVHRLDWFFIVLPSVLLCASLTLVPSLCVLDSKWERHRYLLSFGGFLVSLELLLLATCIYCGGDWFGWAGMSVLFGISLVALPFLLPKLPLPEKYCRCKLSLYLGTETLLLLLLLLICCVYSHGRWFILTASAILFGLGFFFLPVFLHQLPLPDKLKSCRASLYLAIQTGLLLLLLLVSSIYTGGTWFPLTAVSVLFGLGLVCLPVPLHQLALPEELKNNKLLAYFAFESVLLLLVVILSHFYAGSSHLGFDLSLTLLMLGFPWGIMLALRYLPGNTYCRFSAACAWSALWIWFTPWVFELLEAAAYGGNMGAFRYTLATPFMASEWSQGFGSWMSFGLVIIALAVAAIVLAWLGWRKNRTK